MICSAYGNAGSEGTDKRRQTTIDEHQGILDALKQKNVEAAVRAMKIHMEETEKKYQPEPCNEAKCQIKLEDHPKRDFGFCEKSRLTIKKESVIILIVGIPNTEYQIP